MSRSFTKDIVIYGGLAVASRFAAVFTAPIVAAAFSVEDYGILDVITTTVSMFATLSALNLVSGIYRLYFEKEGVARKSLTSTGLIFFLSLSSGLCLVLILLSPVLSDSMFDSTLYTSFLVLSLLRLPGIQLFQLCISILRLKRQSQLYAVVNLSDLFLNIIYVVGLYYLNEISLWNIIAGQLAIQWMTALVSFWFTRKEFNFQWNRDLFREIASYALPQFPSVVINFIMLNSLPIMLTIFATTFDNGIFALGKKMALVIGMLITAFRMAYGPITMKFISNQTPVEVNNFANRSIKLFSLLLVPYYLYCTIAPYVFPVLFEDRFNQSMDILEYLALAFFITGLFNLVAIGINHTKKTKYVSYAQLVAFVVFILLVYPLLNIYGYLGAAILMVLSSIAQLVSTYVFNKRVTGLDVRFVTTLLLAIIVTAISLTEIVLLQLITLALLLAYAYYMIKVRQVARYLNNIT